MWFIQKKKWNKKEVPFITTLQNISNIYLEKLDTGLRRRLSDDERHEFLSFFEKGRYSEMYKCASSFEVNVEYEYDTATYYVHHNALGPNPGGMIQNIFRPSRKGFIEFLDKLDGFSFFTMPVTTLNECYHDKDEILLHASFQILTDYVEKEKPFEIIDWDVNDESKAHKKEITELYLWWKNIRPKRKDPLDNASIEHPSLCFEKEEDEFSRLKSYDKEQYHEFTQAIKEHHELTELWLKEDQENLKRLIDIRLSLWT